MTGGGERDRTDDLVLAKHALSQLSYTPFLAPPPENRLALPAIFGRYHQTKVAFYFRL